MVFNAVNIDRREKAMNIMKERLQELIDKEIQSN
jgi:hypothetical protein